MKKIIEKVDVKNFRIFDNIGRRFEFSGGFTQVVADNGSGKTSLWLAMLICLGGKIPREYDRLGEAGLIHFPQIKDEEKAKSIQLKNNAYIRITLNNLLINGRKLFYEIDRVTDKIIIETILSPTGRTIYRVNNQNWQKSALKDTLGRAGINSDDPLLFLEQHKTTNVLLNGPTGVLSALEDSLTTKTIRINLDEALSSYKSTKEESLEIQGKLNIIELKFNNIKIDYQKFLQYNTDNDHLLKLKDELKSRKFIDAVQKLDQCKDQQRTFKDTFIKTGKENHDLNGNKINLENQGFFYLLGY